MKEWMVLFRAPLVRANREGRKDVTRRLSPKWATAKPGDLLVVRETWRAPVKWDDRKPSEVYGDEDIWYEADGKAPAKFGKLRPSIFLPRWASRDIYPIVSVRQERLQDITEDEARREGVYPDKTPGLAPITARSVYAETWDEINSRDGVLWADNPWVWVVSYRTTETT